MRVCDFHAADLFQPTNRIFCLCRPSYGLLEALFSTCPSICVCAGGGILRPACRRLLVILYCIRSNAVQVTTLLLAMFVCNKYVYLWLVTLKGVCVCDVTLTFQFSDFCNYGFVIMIMVMKTVTNGQSNWT